MESKIHGKKLESVTESVHLTECLPKIQDGGDILIHIKSGKNGAGSMWLVARIVKGSKNISL